MTRRGGKRRTRFEQVSWMLESKNLGLGGFGRGDTTTKEGEERGLG
jgi:hypothetical protein